MKKLIFSFFLLISIFSFGNQEQNVIIERRPEQLVKLDDLILYPKAGQARGSMRELIKSYEEALNRYLESENWDTNIIFMLGNQYFLMEQYERANLVFSKDSTDVKNVFGVALTDRFLGRDLKAIENYSRAINMDPSLGEAYLGRGISYRNIKVYDKAIKDFQKYISTTGRVEGYIVLGDLYNLLGRYKDAKAVVRTGLGKHPKSKELNIVLSSALSKEK